VAGDWELRKAAVRAAGWVCAAVAEKGPDSAAEWVSRVAAVKVCAMAAARDASRDESTAAC